MSLQEQFEEDFSRRLTDGPVVDCVYCRDRRATNQDVHARLTTLRRELGTACGRRVCVLLPDSLEAYLLYLHLFLEQAVIVPISVHAATSQIRYIADTVKADMVVTTEFLFRSHEEVLVKYSCLIMTNSGGPSNVMTYAVAGATPRPGRLMSSPRAAGLVRFIMFTSGSTGKPKGVCLSADNILAAADMMVQFLSMDSNIRSLVTVPLYDYYGMIQVFGHILGRASYTFGITASTPGSLFKTVLDRKCTDLVLVPHTLRTLLGMPGSVKPAAFGALTRITSSSDMLTQDLVDATFDLNGRLAIVNIYGLTEAGRAAYRKITRETPFSASIGVASPGVEIELRNEHDGVGEITICGPNVMLGYLTGIEDDQAVFATCNEMATGDLGYRDENGSIVLVGRRDHVINLMGLKMHPSEIEMAALRLGKISDVRAGVCRQANGDKVIHLDVVCKYPEMTAEQIIDGLRTSVPRAFVPKTVTFVTSIDRTDIGSKVIRKAGE